MNRSRYLTIFKYTVYTLLLLALYILQSVPELFTVSGIKPVWVVSAAIAIAMLEGEFIGGIFGAAAGLLCDIGGFTLLGFNGFVISACCVAAGLVVIYLMHCNLPNCLLFVFLTLLVRGSLEYLFSLGMWGYDNVWKIYVYQTLPVVAYSTLVAPVVYIMVRAIHRKFAEALER